MMVQAGPVKISSMEEIACKYDICRRDLGRIRPTYFMMSSFPQGPRAVANVKHSPGFFKVG